MDLLVLADEEGVIDKTLGSISRITNVPRRVIQKAISTLCSPDHNSRTPSEDGRRLVLIDEHRDWGWKIVNYLKYRQIRDEEARRSSNRSYKRAQRVRDTSDQKPDSQQCQPVSAHTEAEEEADTEAKSKTKSPPKTQLALLEIYEAYPRKVGKPDALKAIDKALWRLKSGVDAPKELFASMDDAIVFLLHRTRFFAKCPAGQNGKFTPHPATWFNSSRYLDDDLEWRKDGNSQLSKGEQRAINNRKVLLQDAGFLPDENAISSGDFVQDGLDSGGDALVGEVVGRGKAERG